MKKKTKYGLIMLAVAIAVLAIDNLIPDDFEDIVEYSSQSVYNEVDHTTTQSSSGNKSAVKHNGTKYVWYTKKDKEGTPSEEALVPASWKIKTNSDNQTLISGPNNLKISPLKSAFHSYAKNDWLRQINEQSGKTNRMLPNINQLVQQDLAPLLNSRGLKVVNIEELPELAKPGQDFHNQIIDFWESNNDNYRKTVKYYGINLSDNHGNPAFAGILLNISENSYNQSWSYSSSLLEVDSKEFESVKKQYLYSLGSTKFRPEFIQKTNQSIAATNQQNQIAIQQSNANFQAKEAARWSNFNQGQAAHQARVNAWNETSMSNYNNRMNSMENQHNNFINTIREEQNMYNPNTGQYMKVESGYNNYWYNPYTNEYLPTNSTYNPNQDPNVNQHNWQQLQQYNQY